MRIKSAPGLKVRDHVTRQHLPDEGLDVPDTNGVPNDPHWQFMLRHQDVVTVKPEQPPSQDAAALPALGADRPDSGLAGHDQ